ncbi:MAG: hypothetical protein HY898_14130 [Deltaproteobacteria bacterium]|nr:hypothetical protein [Deltaproteobacteria bacterium]
MRGRLGSWGLAFSILAWVGPAWADIPSPTAVLSCDDGGKVSFEGTCINKATGSDPCPGPPDKLYGCINQKGTAIGGANGTKWLIDCYQEDSGAKSCVYGISGTVDASCCALQGFDSLCLGSSCYQSESYCGAVPMLDGCSPTMDASIDADDDVQDGAGDSAQDGTQDGARGSSGSSGCGCSLASNHTGVWLGLIGFVLVLWVAAYRRMSWR